MSTNLTKAPAGVSDYDVIYTLQRRLNEDKQKDWADKQVALDFVKDSIESESFPLKGNSELMSIAAFIRTIPSMVDDEKSTFKSKAYEKVIDSLTAALPPSPGGRRRRRGKTLRRRKQRKTRRRGFRGGANEALAQIANDLDSQIPAIVSAHSTNQPMQYTPKVESEVITAALAAVPVAEAPSGVFDRVWKFVSSKKTPADKVREFLEELSTKKPYTFSNIVEPESIRDHLRTLSA